MTYKAQSKSRIAATAVLLTAVSVFPAFAQQDYRDTSASSVQSRIDRLERDITTLSQSVYNGKAPSGPLETTQASANASASLIADLQVRLDSIDEANRRLTGQIEEQNYKIQQLQEQFTKLQNDNEARFQALEQKAAAAPAASPVAAPSGLTSPADDVSMNPPAPVPAPNAAAGTTTSGEMYDNAFGYIRSGDYAKAENAFTEFLGKYPKDKLSANAEYWLAETYYVRGQFDKAAAAFARGYQNHPKSPKASDNLLKLALSLGSMNRKDDACLALVQLETDFPKAAKSLKDRVIGEKSKLGCK